MADQPAWVEEGLAAAVPLLPNATEPWVATTLPGTGGGSYASVVVRFCSADESVVVKLIERNDLDPQHPRWWGRELEAYSSTWLQGRLPTRVGMPDLLASTTTDAAAVLVLADIDFDEHRSRDAAWYGSFGTAIGSFNGAPVDPGEVPQWATRGFVQQQISEANDGIAATLAEPSRHVRPILDPWLGYLQRIGEQSDSIVARLEAERTGFHHLDAFSRNVALAGGRYKLIDWAYAGLAPLGTDAAAIISITAIHGDVEGSVGEFADAVCDGYVEGVSTAGGQVAGDTVRAAIDLAVTLRFAVSLTEANSLGEDVYRVALEVCGRPLDEMLELWLDANEALGPIAERSLAAVGA